MTVGDVLILILVLLPAVRGYRRGFVRETIETFGALVAALVTYRFHSTVADLVGIGPDSSWISKVALCVVIFLGVMILVTLVGAKLTKLLESISLGTFNKVIGSLLGVLKAALIIGVVTLAAVWIGSESEQMVAESKLARANMRMLSFLSRSLPDDLREKFDSLTIPVDSTL